MGDPDSDTHAATTSMRILRGELTEPRATAHEATRRATRVHGAATIDLGILDHLEKSRTELIAATRRIALNAGPAPVDEGIYEWSDRATAHLAPYERRARDVVAYRQSLEHAIRSGRPEAVRRDRCPACRCLSLLWSEAMQRAVCIQDECRDEYGRARRWELKQIAYYHVASRPQRAAN